MRYVLRPYTFLPYVLRVNRFKQSLDGHIRSILRATFVCGSPKRLISNILKPALRWGETDNLGARLAACICAVPQRLIRRFKGFEIFLTVTPDQVQGFCSSPSAMTFKATCLGVIRYASLWSGKADCQDRNLAVALLPRWRNRPG